jgi:hypothetical protein
MEELLAILLDIEGFCKNLHYDVVSVGLSGNLYTVKIHTSCEKEECVDEIKLGLESIGCRAIKLIEILKIDRRNYYIILTFRI